MIGRTALITGASRGIGGAIAEFFRELGAVVLSPPRQELDLSSNESIEKYCKALELPVDILINNAGINPLGSAGEFSDADLVATIQINLIAPMKLVRAFSPGMASRGYGRILNISSIWGAVSKQRRFVYTTTKSGINGMTRSAAVELSGAGVLVNALAPGFVNTTLTMQNNSEEDLLAIAASIPAGRLAEPAEIAEVAAFLCSSRNSYISGQTLFVDGGFTCQ